MIRRKDSLPCFDSFAMRCAALRAQTQLEMTETEGEKFKQADKEFSPNGQSGGKRTSSLRGRLSPIRRWQTDAARRRRSCACWRHSTTLGIGETESVIATDVP